MSEHQDDILVPGEKGNDGKCSGLADVSFLDGVKVKKAGYFRSPVNGRGFGIDYYDNDGKEMRVVFAYNDLGFWVKCHYEINPAIQGN